jgi:hypothetical protein
LLAQELDVERDTAQELRAGPLMAELDLYSEGNSGMESRDELMAGIEGRYQSCKVLNLVLPSMLEFVRNVAESFVEIVGPVGQRGMFLQPGCEAYIDMASQLYLHLEEGWPVEVALLFLQHSDCSDHE